MIKKILIILLGQLVLFQVGYAALIFISEEEGSTADTFVLDTDYSSTDFINLQFGETLNAVLQYDIVNDKFIFGTDVDMGGNELLNLRIEQLASAPTCNEAASGRLYFNTGDSNTYSCNGTAWEDLTDGAGGSGGGFTVNTTPQTTDYDTLAVDTINVLTSTSDNRPSDHQYIVKTLGNAFVKTQVATSATARYYRVYEDSAWADWQTLTGSVSLYRLYTLDSIDQTDGTVSYIGRKRTSDDKWLISNSQSSGIAYAQEQNNSGTTTFATAWTNRLTLNYGASFVP